MVSSEEQHRNRAENHLHLIRRRSSSSSSSKPCKKPPNIASTATTTQPRVYKVKPVDFRELVQRLTGASQKSNTPTYDLNKSESQRDGNSTNVEERGSSKVEQAFAEDEGENFHAWFSLALSSSGSVL